MQLVFNAVQTDTNKPELMTMYDLKEIMSEYQHLQHFKDYSIKGQPKSKDQIPQDIRTYYTLRALQQ